MGQTQGNVELGWHDGTELVARYHLGASSTDVRVPVSTVGRTALRPAVLNNDLKNWAALYATPWFAAIESDPDPAATWDLADDTARQLVAPVW